MLPWRARRRGPVPGFLAGRSERENFSEATRRAHGDGLDGAALDALRGEENGGEGGDVQHEVCPPSRGREGGGEGYLAVKRRGFHVDEGGGDLEATTRAVLIGEANLEGDVLPGGDHQLEHQVGLLQADCEGGKRGEGDAGGSGGGWGGGARRRSARRAREKPTDHTREGGHARPLRSSLGSCILCPGPPPMVYTYPFTFFSYRRFTDLPPHDIFPPPSGPSPASARQSTFVWRHGRVSIEERVGYRGGRRGAGTVPERTKGSRSR